MQWIDTKGWFFHIVWQYTTVCYMSWFWSPIWVIIWYDGADWYSFFIWHSNQHSGKCRCLHWFWRPLIVFNAMMFFSISFVLHANGTFFIEDNTVQHFLGQRTNQQTTAHGGAIDCSMVLSGTLVKIASCTVSFSWDSHFIISVAGYRNFSNVEHCFGHLCDSGKSRNDEIMHPCCPPTPSNCNARKKCQNDKTHSLFSALPGELELLYQVLLQLDLVIFYHFFLLLSRIHDMKCKLLMPIQQFYHWHEMVWMVSVVVNFLIASTLSKTSPH